MSTTVNITVNMGFVVIVNSNIKAILGYNRSFRHIPQW